MGYGPCSFYIINGATYHLQYHKFKYTVIRRNKGGPKMAPRQKADLMQVSFRTREPLRAALESAAKARGVSMNTEMNERLMRSFEDEVKLETEFARVQLYAILRVIANTMD